jgi:hypothetical protein
MTYAIIIFILLLASMRTVSSRSGIWGKTMLLALTCLYAWRLDGAYTAYSVEKTVVRQHASIESHLARLTGPEIDQCLAFHQIKDGTYCFIFSYDYPIESFDAGIGKSLMDFKNREGRIFSWMQVVQLDDGKLFDKMVAEDKDDKKMVLAIKSSKESVILLAEDDDNDSDTTPEKNLLIKSAINIAILSFLF